MYLAVHNCLVQEKLTPKNKTLFHRSCCLCESFFFRYCTQQLQCMNHDHRTVSCSSPCMIQYLLIDRIIIDTDDLRLRISLLCVPDTNLKGIMLMILPICTPFNHISKKINSRNNTVNKDVQRRTFGYRETCFCSGCFTKNKFPRLKSSKCRCAMYSTV